MVWFTCIIGDSFVGLWFMVCGTLFVGVIYGDLV